jgi:alkylated DNA nucleotide flippase Atl1
MSPRTAAGNVVGIALAPGVIAAARAGMPTVWERDLDLNGGANGSVDALRDALRDAARASGLERPSAVIALLPPLAELRSVSLPPLDEDDRNRFLARNAARYFVSARGPQVVGTAVRRSGRKGDGEAPVLAAAAPTQLLSAVEAAAHAAGVPVTGVIPAEAAWAAAALEIWPALARGPAAVAVARDDRVDLLSLHDGELLVVRRFRGAADADGLANAMDEGARAAVLGTPDAARLVAEALAARGIRVMLPDAAWAGVADRPDVLAARYAAGATALVVRTEESIQRGRAGALRLAGWLAGMASAALLAAAAIHYAGVRRELGRVQQARAAIRAQVEATLVGRSSVDAAYRQVAALAGTSREAPRWSAVLAAFARQLPDDASLVAFRARGDSVFLDGVADRAAPVFDNIGRTPGVTGVRATAPVRRESIEGEAPLEHFAVGAQIARRRP